MEKCGTVKNVEHTYIAITIHKGNYYIYIYIYAPQITLNGSTLFKKI